MFVAAVVGQFGAHNRAASLYLMREKYIKPTIACQTFEGANVHLLLLLQLAEDALLDVYEDALLVVACLALAGVYERLVLAVADCALGGGVVHVEVHF